MDNYEDIDKINSLLHYMKGIEPFSRTFASLTKSRSKWCPFLHGKRIDHDCYRSNPEITGLLRWTNKYIACCKYIDTDRHAIDLMSEVLAKLQNPELVIDRKGFDAMLADIRRLISFVENNVNEKLNTLSCRECERLDEALVCFQNYCFYSTVVMAVSAVEHRIHEMIKRRNPTLHDRQFKNAMLGQLVQIFDDNAYKEKKYQRIKRLMPRKHRPLVTLLNEYRVFSAHPKEEKVTAQIAESVLHLCFAFLTDPDTCPYDKKELKCSQPQQAAPPDRQ